MRRHRRRSTRSCGWIFLRASTSRSNYEIASQSHSEFTSGKQNCFPGANLSLSPEIDVKGIVGRKIGMTQVFDQETGASTPVTVIEAGPCPVVAIRTADADGYDAVQLAFDEVRERKLTKPELGHLRRHGVKPHRRLVEIRGEHDLTPGATVTVDAFEPGEKVKVSGVSIGKGFQGTVKRHRFGRGPVTHGSHNTRAPGSIGASATPSRVYKGLRMAGHMGARSVTQLGLTVVDRVPEENLLLVKGAVPGHKNAVVVVREDKR